MSLRKLVSVFIVVVWLVVQVLWFWDITVQALATQDMYGLGFIVLVNAVLFLLSLYVGALLGGMFEQED